MLIFIVLLAARGCDGSTAGAVVQPGVGGEIVSSPEVANLSAGSTFVGKESTSNASRSRTWNPLRGVDPNGDGKHTESVLAPYLRYLWWLVVLYCFWAQAEVCDEYFVPTIELMAEKFHIPEDVAGATIMALGCNGPELFINCASLYQQSSLGVGAVVGGEVFNLLVLIGCSLIATPAIYMPLKISKFSFSRDIVFYALSIGLLYWTLDDGLVTLSEALVLIVAGCTYSMTVACSPSLRLWYTKVGTILSRGTRRQREPLHIGSQAALAAQCSPETTPCAGLDEEAVITSPEEGCMLKVRVRLENRMNDRVRQWDRRFITLSDEGLLVSTGVTANAAASRLGRTARGIVYEHHGSAAGAGCWHYGGLINAPTQTFLASSQGPHASSQAAHGATQSRLDGSSAVHACSGESVPLGGMDDSPWELISLRDVVACEPNLNPASSRFEVHVLQRSDGVTLFRSKIIQLEIDARTAAMRKRWVSAVKQKMADETVQRVKASTETESSQTSTGKVAIKQWADWFRFPVQFLLKLTIPDMKHPPMRRWYMVAFMMSMVWLASFSFCVVQVCEILHDEFNIPVKLLGFTVAAVGTSFPNVISCIAVSRRGKTPMAIANALGANIQNVFVALALPWTLNAAVYGSFKVGGDGLGVATLGMLVTLGLCILIVLLACCTMPRWVGVSFLLLYAIYLVLSIGEEMACNAWPFPCK
jgi:Ca2+/Na+ antiporter